MKKILLALALAAVTSMPAAAQGPIEDITAIPEGAVTQCQWINGYVRSDGTYVQGHWRGCP